MIKQKHPWIGRKARDIITNFEGTITGHADYITGCDQFLVQGKVVDPSQPAQAFWYDEQRIELIGSSVLLLDNSAGNGAAGAAPIK